LASQFMVILMKWEENLNIRILCIILENLM
jgi:hypothetical protein